MYYVWVQGAETGPYSLEQLQGKINDGTLPAGTPVRRRDQPDWVLIESMTELVGLPSPAPVLAGFWRRTSAWLLDALILGIPVLLLGIPLFGLFVSLHLWGLLLGFCLAATYFGLLNSRVGEGQTLGNRLLGIAVVDSNGKPVALGRSLLRYAVLAGPTYLSGCTSALALSGWGGRLINSLLFVWAVLILYLYAFNRRSRQGLHDMAAGTYVIRRPGSGAILTQPIWRGHWVIVGVILFASFGLGLGLDRLISSSWLKEVVVVRDTLQTETEIDSASVFRGTTVFFNSSGSKTITTYTATVAVNSLSVDATQEQKKVAAIILAKDPEASDVDRLSVTVSYGYNLGVASWHHSHTDTHSPAEWKALPGNPPGI